MGLLRDFGRREGGSDHYLSVGWNLKFTDLQAVIGVSQMQRIAQIVERKRAIFDRYRTRLAGLDALRLPETDISRITPWFVDVLLRDVAEKRALMAYLTSHGIGSRPLYPTLHAEPAFNAAGPFPHAEAASAGGLWLPSSLRLTDADVDRVCDRVRAFCTAQSP